MTRYNIEETAVYDKYVRWCGRTGPRGPSYPIRWKLISIAHPNPENGYAPQGVMSGFD